MNTKSQHTTLSLHSYFRSSAAFRVRIALNMKGLNYDVVPVNLLKNEQNSTSYKSLNPQGLVPLLEIDQQETLSQSMAILEWLEETYPSPPLFPKDILDKNKVRSICYQIACDIHPICNLRVLQHVANTLNQGDDGKLAWIHKWISTGFNSLEKQVATQFAFGSSVSMADVLIIPQVYNALRFNIDISDYPNIKSIYDHCNTLPAFIDAHPDNQQ